MKLQNAVHIIESMLPAERQFPDLISQEVTNYFPRLVIGIAAVLTVLAVAAAAFYVIEYE